MQNLLFFDEWIKHNTKSGEAFKVDTMPSSDECLIKFSCKD